MTYAAGGLIQANDYTTGIAQINTLWSTGTSNAGYGQTTIPTVSVGQTVGAAEWNSFFTAQTKMAAHQGTAITALPTVVAGGTITYLSQLAPGGVLISNNRLNAVAQGTTSTSVNTTTTTWSTSKTVTFTVTFASHNNARYFFNAGGQIGISASHPAGTGSSINQLISSLCSEAGTTWFSSPISGTVSLAGINYSGVTKSGGGYPAGSTINTNYGFYSAGSTSTQIMKQISDFSYHAYGTSTFMTISVAYNGSGTLTFTVLYDEVPDGAVVSTGTVTTLTVRPPSTTYLTDSWGTPGLSNV